MNNIKPYCQFVHRQVSIKGRLFPQGVLPPVQGNAIILLTFLKEQTLLADIFTLTEVVEEAHLTRLVATNQKGDNVVGTWVDGRYAWQNNIEDLHSWVETHSRRCYRLSFRYHKRYLQQAIQCVKDHIPLCGTLLPDGCDFTDTVLWARPVKRFWSRAAVGTQILIMPFLFMASGAVYFLLASFLLMGVYSFFRKREENVYFKSGGMINAALWEEWLTLSGNIIDRVSRNTSLTDIKNAMDALFQDAIERTSPGYDLLMRTRYRLAQELLEDIMQHDELPKVKFNRYRARVVGFILDL